MAGLHSVMRDDLPFAIRVLDDPCGVFGRIRVVAHQAGQSDGLADGPVWVPGRLRNGLCRLLQHERVPAAELAGRDEVVPPLGARIHDELRQVLAELNDAQVASEVERHLPTGGYVLHSSSVPPSDVGTSRASKTRTTGAWVGARPTARRWQLSAGLLAIPLTP